MNPARALALAAAICLTGWAAVIGAAWAVIDLIGASL